MSELMSLQDMANGHLDVKALGEAANGDENTIVTTRTGNTYPSAERAINIMFQNGGLPAKPFATKAKMITDGASLPDDSYAMVTNEKGVDAINNGLYVKAAGAWVKSTYDPATTAKDYTDNKISKLNSYTVNTDKPFPLVKNPISGYTSLGSSLIYSMIVDAEIKNADPNYYYKISYFANGATNFSALGNGVQVDKVLKTQWDVETQHVNDSILLSGARTAQDFVLIKNSGLQKVKLNLERSTYKEEVTIVFDTDHPSFLSGVAISANTRSQAGYDYSLSSLRVFKETGATTTPEPVDPTTPSSSPFAGKKLVCFGDSITEFGNYPELIKQRLGLAESYNVGFGGARFAKHSDDGYIQMSMFKLAEYIAANDFTELLAAAERLATSAVADDNRPQAALLASIDFSTVDYISIFYGSNDAKNRALGDDSDYSAGGNTFKAAINYTLQNIMTKHPHIKVLLVTPHFSSRGDIAGGSDTNPNTLGVYLSDYVDAINTLGAQNKVPVLDMLRTSGINKFNSAHYLTDGLHPTVAGTRLIADKIASKLTATY